MRPGKVFGSEQFTVAWVPPKNVEYLDIVSYDELGNVYTITKPHVHPEPPAEPLSLSQQYTAAQQDVISIQADNGTTRNIFTKDLI